MRFPPVPAALLQPDSPITAPTTRVSPSCRIPPVSCAIIFFDRCAIVTGACRGIGRAIADALAAAETEVHVFDVNEPAPGNNFHHHFTRVDIADAAAVSEAVAALPSPATLLVNNAGINRDRSLGKMSDSDWASVIAINLTGAFNMIRAVAPRMATQNYGRIVNITSINDLRGKFGQSNYAAAKTGLIGLTKTAAREFRPKGITVNAVAPGLVMTDMARKLPPEIVKRAADEAALPDLTEPADISNAVLCLLSDGGRAITGEVLRVDAGQYI
ncbi:MAG: SDR family oxidoreductase [Rhizobiales bacterium]|nr:SDR family oxidoreductase [Hyphomicrobiales bacterium]